MNRFLVFAMIRSLHHVGRFLSPEDFAAPDRQGIHGNDGLVTVADLISEHTKNIDLKKQNALWNTRPWILGLDNPGA